MPSEALAGIAIAFVCRSWPFLVASFIFTICLLVVATAHGPCGHQLGPAILSTLTGYC